MNTDDVTRLVERELAAFVHQESRSKLDRGRVEPYCEMRHWDYGSHEIEYPCWVVFESSRDVGIAYCESGFGPKAPWGLLWLKGPRNMGQDCGWFPSLEEALANV